MEISRQGKEGVDDAGGLDDSGAAGDRLLEQMELGTSKDQAVRSVAWGQRFEPCETAGGRFAPLETIDPVVQLVLIVLVEEADPLRDQLPPLVLLEDLGGAGPCGC